MIDFMFDVLQTTGLGTLFFTVLLCCKRAIQRGCGIRYWHYVLLVNSVMFMIPVFPLKLALAPLAHPLRLLVQASPRVDMVNRFNIFTTIYPPDEVLVRGILTVWVFGIVVFLAIACAMYVSFIVSSRKKTYAVPSVVSDAFARVLSDDKLKKSTRLNRAKLLLNDEIASPISFGFFRSSIVLPGKIINNYDVSDICLMLLHEAMHIRNNDVWKRLFVLLVRSIHWFNPVIPYLSRHITESMELYCDEIIISRSSDDDIHNKYGELLLSMADNRRKYAIFGQLMATGSFTAQRLKRIYEESQRPKASHKTFFTAILFVISLTYLTGFAVFDQQIVHTYPTGFVDYGIELQDAELPQRDIIRPTYNLSENGVYVFEGNLLADTMVFAPDSFGTDTTAISLTLLSDAPPILVSLCYTSDIDYTLMELVMEKTNVQYTFSMLSSIFTYSIGFTTSADYEHEALIQIGD